MDVEDKAHLDLLAALLVAFAALGCVVALLFIAVEGLKQPKQPFTPLSYLSSKAQSTSTSSDGSPGLLLSPLAANNSGVVVSVLDNDQDHDGNYDNMADSLVALGFLLAAVGSIGLGFRPSVGGRLVWACCETPKLRSVFVALRERPG